MLNHFVHGAFLQKLSILVAVLAIVEIGAAIRVCAAVLDARQWHAATLAELRQLAFLEGFLLCREGGFVSLESIRILLCHKVTLRRAVGSLTIAPIARYQFLSEKIWHF